jgi:hypothetical protein
MLIVNGKEDLHAHRRSLHLARIRQPQVSESLPRRPHGPDAANLSDDREMVEERASLNVVSIAKFATVELFSAATILQ